MVPVLAQSVSVTCCLLALPWCPNASQEDGGANNDWSKFCHSAFMENFAFANRTMSQLLGCEQASGFVCTNPCCVTFPMNVDVV